MDPAAQYALAYALTTTAGVRALFALAAVSVAAHFGVLHPPEGFAWLGSAAAMWSLCAVALVEIAADKVPVLDHAMHVLGVAIKPAAGAVLAGGSLHGLPAGLLVALMVLGALNALGVHAAIAAVRGASTVTTGGLANPAVSLAEDGGSAISLVLAIALPFAGALLALGFSLALLLLARAAYKTLRHASKTSPGAMPGESR